MQYKPKEIFATNVISVSNCNYELAQWIEKLGPWGEGAPEPNLIIKNSTIKNVNRKKGQIKLKNYNQGN